MSEFIAIDGDDVGAKLRERIIANNVQEAATFSSAIVDYFESIREILEIEKFDVIFCGGDSLLATNGHSLSSKWFETLPSGPCTISVGIGGTPEYAYLALQLAKARGKNQVIHLTQTTVNTVYFW